MAGLGPAIHVFRPRKDMDARPAQTSVRSLRKLDCVAGHDGGKLRFSVMKIALELDAIGALEAQDLTRLLWSRDLIS